jgi:ribosomal protein L37AE/L43A
MKSSSFENVITRVASGLGTGKRCLSTSCTRPPSTLEKFSKIRCGYCSETVESRYAATSCRRRTLFRVKYTVGPCGKCETIIASAGVSDRCALERGRRDEAEKRRTRNTAVLVKDNEVGDLIRAACIRELAHNVVAAVHACRARKDEPDLLRKLQKLAAWVARGRHEHFRVAFARPCVLIIHVRRGC